MSAFITVRSLCVDECLPIRQRVLWPKHTQEQCRVPDDEHGTHLGLYVEGELVGCGSLFTLNDQEIRLRKFAVLPEHQGQGLGSRLFNALISTARAHNATRLVFDARTSATDFYQKRGCQTVGDVFDKSGVPFIRMQRPL
ncbi:MULTISPECIES: GNAT family N-acetyltransferase [unclassified Saccharibacter]|uniref:GNAT family N-acetyltransferase n=1 Tax=unclassified Saccharibacter TaxID=2648722 RepID=UPI00132371A0|nr:MULTISPECIES: GNAT family N-acetyltransferase [unclassified Saccharibacter]MXV37042.1 GNAT family N-acetyltransferase [Saccharibacter sp. EH611]MXV58468.1 GNAT family N-acetyltransferase [Saccharibacter sp. EH70]MXV65974.1 GNAT family N-acetyltransferase [Saccharibacter sp. EH60]